VIDCDDLATRAAVRDDPARFVESDQPVLIDEYQHVPELLDAIKAQLNRDLRPGRYVLAGSTRYATLPQAAQALTGRVDIIPVLPLSQGEIGNIRETFVARLLDGAGIEMASPKARTTRDEYAQRSTSGGMPVALRRPPGRSRSRWFSNYVNLVIDRDALDVSRVRQREMLPRLLGQLAARSGQVLNMAAISGTIGLEKSTAENYIKLLEAVFLIYRLPAWGTTLGSRVSKHPKVHLVDSGVMAWLLNLTPQKIAQAAPATLTEYGHLLETFAVGEILKQASWSDAPVTAGHFRTEAGDEVDLVLERDDGQVIAVEIKAGSRISGEDFRGLRQLKDRLGPRLEEAIILHTGEHAYTHDDWIRILPLDRLWA
jgi:predicted AAA+ superfamily ATPase